MSPCYSRDEPCGAGEAEQGVEEAEQGVEEAGVRDVDLGRTHLSLADVLEPGLKLADDEDRGQGIQVPAHRSRTRVR